MFVVLNAMYLRGIVVLAIVPYFLSHAERLDTREDPVRDYLKLDHGSPYELVAVQFPDRLHKRASVDRTIRPGLRMKIRAFGDDINLWLYPRDSILSTEDTPIYSSTNSSDSPGGVSIRRRLGLMKRLGNVLEDPKHLASLTISVDQHGRRTVNGRIGSKKIVVKSIPRRVINKYVRHRRSIDETDPDFSESRHHAVYRIDDGLEDYIFGAINKTILHRVGRSAQGVPFLLFPKILVVVEHSIYKQQGGNIYSFLEYILTFMNGVDLKYRGLERPRVRFHIAGIMIGLTPGATPYISNLMISEKAFNGNQAMVKATKFFYEIRESIPLASYDIALTLTRLEFGLEGSSKILGKAWTGSVCQNSSKTLEMRAIAIVRDDGVFLGVHSAAHEIGHVLGLEHDVMESDDCRFTNGFLMSLVPWYTKNSTSFSSCSLKGFQKAIDQGHLKCTYPRPRTYNSRLLPKLMPGKVRGLKEQCFVRGYGPPCSSPFMDICVNFACYNSEGVCHETGVAALEGTPCSGENETIDRFCIHNQCVSVE